ncbi:uncharacterized protein [Triticum aestivum]|uniref:uncharacterized protein n=1 Tax=Triticum aestivum TaxID=4565 RepID=UPI001D0060C9|nr:uncharacterized protein LOC123129602 [Triticum aestivum]
MVVGATGHHPWRPAHRHAWDGEAHPLVRSTPSREPGSEQPATIASGARRAAPQLTPTAVADRWQPPLHDCLFLLRPRLFHLARSPSQVGQRRRCSARALLPSPLDGRHRRITAPSLAASCHPNQHSSISSTPAGRDGQVAGNPHPDPQVTDCPKPDLQLGSCPNPISSSAAAPNQTPSSTATDLEEHKGIGKLLYAIKIEKANGPDLEEHKAASELHVEPPKCKKRKRSRQSSGELHAEHQETNKVVMKSSTSKKKRKASEGMCTNPSAPLLGPLAVDMDKQAPPLKKKRLNKRDVATTPSLEALLVDKDKKPSPRSSPVDKNKQSSLCKKVARSPVLNNVVVSFLARRGKRTSHYPRHNLHCWLCHPK